MTKDLKELESKGEVDLNRFLEFSRTHHSLLWPAFQMQLYLKKKMMGVRFWKSHAERRVKLSKNKYVKIKDLLVMVSNDIISITNYCYFITLTNHYRMQKNNYKLINKVLLLQL